MAKTPYQLWKEEQEKKKRGEVQPSRSPRNPIQYTNPTYKGESATRRESYEWEKDNLKSLSTKRYGRSYNDKFSNWAKKNGLDEREAREFRRWMDAKDDGVKTKASLTDNILTNLNKRNEADAERIKNRPKQEKPEPKKKEKKKPSLANDILSPLKRFGQAINPFDDVSFTEAFRRNVQDALSTDRSKVTKETTRGLTRIANSSGALDEIYKRTNGERAPQFKNDDRSTSGKVADFGYDALGYLIPGIAAVKGVRALGLGAKEAKGLSKLAQIAKEGAIVGGAMGAAEVGIREGLNPQDYNWKQNLGHVGIGTAAGAIADPALHGLGRLAKNALSKRKGAVEPLGLPEPRLGLPEPKELTKQPNTSPLEFRESKFVKNDLERKLKDALKPSGAKNSISGFDPTKLKDISGLRAATTDVYRIFRDVFGKDYDKVGKPVIDKLDFAKKNYVDMQEKWAKKLKTEVVDKLGIKKGSKESALVQRYGEKKMTLEELKKAAPNKWKDIVKADQWFRQSYDELIEQVNATRTAIYPNNPEKLVPKRKDYYRHFRELNGLTGLKNIFDSPAQISPQLAGLSQHTNPNAKWHGFMQKRGLGPYKEDAVGGFLEYIPGASYATNIDRVIPEFKNLRKQLADSTEDSRNINNFIEFLYNFPNDLAGKTNPYFDRNLQQIIGRKPMAVLNWANNRVKKNVILGNIGSTLAQLANIPNGVAFAKHHSVKGAGRTLASVFDKNAPIHQSPFLKERYIDKIYRQFDERLIDQPEKMASWLIETADRVGTSFVWNSAYEKGLAKGVKNPIQYADENTRRLVAGRGIGEVPLMQKSKTVQLVMPFTLEVANLWHVMRDFVKAKDFGAITTLFLGNFLLNKVMEETRGSKVTFDPIDAIYDAVTDKELSNTQRAGRLAGEVLTNFPSGQHLAGLYPEDGKLLNFKGPTRTELFGDRNPQRFGTGLVSLDAVSDPLFRLLPPFGGNQVDKTLKGLEALKKEGVYKKGDGLDIPFLNEGKELKYPVEPSLQNIAKGTLFGPSALNEAKDYYENKRRPLSEKQTEAFRELEKYGKGKEYYNDLMTERRVKTLERKIKEIDNDKKMSANEKRKKIIRLLEELQSLQ